VSIVFYLLTVLKEWTIVLIPDVQVQVATHVVCQLKGLVTGCGQVPTNLKVLRYIVPALLRVGRVGLAHWGQIPHINLLTFLQF